LTSKLNFQRPTLNTQHRISARVGEADLAFPLLERLLQTPGAVDSADDSITVNDLKFRWEWDPIRSFRNSRMRTLKAHEAFRLTGKASRRRYTEPTTTYNYVVVGLL
jgi:hypothetical protein